MRPTVPLRKALADPQLLGNALVGDSWEPWRTLLIAAMGEPLQDDERETFKQLTGREHEPLQRVGSAHREIAQEQSDVLAFADKNREIVEVPQGLETGDTQRRKRGARTDLDCINEICELIAQGITATASVRYVGVPWATWQLCEFSSTRGGDIGIAAWRRLSYGHRHFSRPGELGRGKSDAVTEGDTLVRLPGIGSATPEMGAGPGN